jgi:hypothetical protein
MFSFWIDPSFISMNEIAAALTGIAVVVSTLLGRPA